MTRLSRWTAGSQFSSVLRLPLLRGRPWRRRLPLELPELRRLATRLPRLRL